jgi:hypothetical protein
MGGDIGITLEVRSENLLDQRLPKLGSSKLNQPVRIPGLPNLAVEAELDATRTTNSLQAGSNCVYSFFAILESYSF